MAKQNVAGSEAGGTTRKAPERRLAQTLITIPGQAPQMWEKGVSNARLAIGNVIERLNDPIGIRKGVVFEVQRETEAKSGKFAPYFRATVTAELTSKDAMRVVQAQLEYAI